LAQFISRISCEIAPNLLFQQDIYIWHGCCTERAFINTRRYSSTKRASASGSEQRFDSKKE